MKKEEKCIRLLEEAIKQYDRIFLFDKEEYIYTLFNTKIGTSIHRKILILSSGQRELSVDSITFWDITKEEKEQIINLYFTYEFSDKFLFISRRNINYGGIFHFVDTGIIKMEEVIEALII